MTDEEIDLSLFIDEKESSSDEEDTSSEEQDQRNYDEEGSSEFKSKEEAIHQRYNWIKEQFPVPVRPTGVDCPLSKCLMINWLDQSLKRIQIHHPESGKVFRKVAVAFNALLKSLGMDPSKLVPDNDPKRKSNMRSMTFWLDCECLVRKHPSNEKGPNPKEWISMSLVLPEQLRSIWNPLTHDKNDQPPTIEKIKKTSRGRKRKSENDKSSSSTNDVIVTKIAKLESQLKNIESNVDKILSFITE